jgi:hypothetical protein
MLEASEARHAYGALDTEHLKWKKSKSAESKEGREGAASASDPALCARVDKLVSEQSLLVNEVASLRSGITQIEMLLRQGLPSAGAAAPVAPLLGRPALQPRRLSAAGGCEQSTRQLLAAAAGGVLPPLQAVALPAAGVAACAPAAAGARTGARPLNNLEA